MIEFNNRILKSTSQLFERIGNKLQGKSISLIPAYIESGEWENYISIKKGNEKIGHLEFETRFKSPINRDKGRAIYKWNIYDKNDQWITQTDDIEEILKTITQLSDNNLGK